MSVTAVPLQPTRRSYVVLLWIGIVAAIIIAVLLAFQGTAAVVAAKGSNDQFLAWNAKQPGVKTTADGLEYRVLKVGDGKAHPTDDDVTLINYRGTFRDGSVFDASKQPTPMPVQGNIPGFSEALKLMTKGAKYRFWMKPDLAYGADGRPPVIPPNSMLTFDVELVDFLPQSVLQQQMQMMQMQQQGGMPGGAQGGATPPGGQ